MAKVIVAVRKASVISGKIGEKKIRGVIKAVAAHPFRKRIRSRGISAGCHRPMAWKTVAINAISKIASTDLNPTAKMGCSSI